MRREVILAACAAVLPILSNYALATDYTLTNTGGGSFAWETSSIWTPNGIPSVAGDTATLSVALTGNTTLGITGTDTVSGITIGSTGSAVNTTIADGGGSLIFDFANPASSGTITINSIGVAGATNAITAPITFTNSPVTSTNSGGQIVVTGTNNLTLGNITNNADNISTDGTTLFSRSIYNQLNNATLTLGNIAITQAGAIAAGTFNIFASGTIDSSGTPTIVNRVPNTVLNGIISDGGKTGGTITFGNTSASIIPANFYINGSNTYTATTVLNRGNYYISNSSAFGTGQLQAGNPSGQFGFNIISTDDSLVLPNKVRIVQNFTFKGNSLTFGSVVFSSNNRNLENLLPSGKTLTFNNAVAGTGTSTSGQVGSITFDGSGYTRVNGPLLNDASFTTNDGTTANAVGSIASFVKNGTGLTFVNPVNTYNATGTYLLGGVTTSFSIPITQSDYTGATIVNGGELDFATSAAYGQTGSVTVNAGGAIGIRTGTVSDTTFLGKFAAGSVSTGGLALGAADAAANINYTTGALSGANLVGVSLGAVATGLNFTGTITPAVASGYRLGGGGTLTLSGTNQLSGSNNVSIVNGGTVAVVGSDSYTGTTVINGAYIVQNQQAAALDNSSSLQTGVYLAPTLRVTALSNGGVASGIGAASSAASNLTINGGTLAYDGAGSSTDRLFTIAPQGTTLEASGNGSVNFTNTGAIALSDPATVSGTFTSGSGTINLVGTDVSQLVVGQVVSGTSVGGAGTATITAVAPTYIRVNSNSSAAQAAAAIPLTVGGGTRALNLTGTSIAANTLTPTLNNSATGTLAVNKTGSGKWILAGNNTYTGGTNITGGTLGVGSPTALGTGSVSVSAGTLQLAQAAGTAYKTTPANLVISGTGKVDLTNNALILDYTGALGTLLTDTKNQIVAGTLTTSSTGANTALGYGDNAVLGKTTFGGQTVDSDSVLVKYTYKGDANLDGTVNIADLGLLATNYGQSGKTWTDGDFNNDGTVNIADLGALATSYGLSNPTGMSFSQALQSIGFGSLANQVPEPGTLSLLAVAGLTRLCRRRSSK